MKRLQILLAEDNRGDVLLVQECLQEHAIDHDLHVLPDGKAALDYVMSIGKSSGVQCPDLVLLDLNLPRVGGASVLRELRQIPECAGAPVIVVTSSDSPKDREEVAELGISYYFRKPTEYDEYMRLGEIVKQVVAQQKS